jgi:hypothetical protein
MKQTDSVPAMRDLKLKAEEKGLQVSIFTEDMRDSSNDQKVAQNHELKLDSEILYLGVLVFGKKSDVEELTDEFERV